MKWFSKKEVSNRDVIFGMLIAGIAGFTWAYLHWGKGIYW